MKHYYFLFVLFPVATCSCPNIRNEAFVASRLDEQMTIQVSEWVANQTKGARLSSPTGSLASGKSKKSLRISRIFLWFKDDFASKATNEPGQTPNRASEEVVGSGEVYFIKKHAELDIPDDIEVEYFYYNWSLNAFLNEGS